jgi:C-terminal processing protease CtpA/Prc
MIRFRNGLFLTALLVMTGQLPLAAATNNPSPDFQEVFDLIRQHAAGMSTDELNRAAVQGLLAALGPKVSLGTNNASADAATKPVAETTLFDDDIAYLRITRVEYGLAKAVSAAIEQLKATNKVNGIVLDLRYAHGSGYKAATDTVDLFVSKSQPLLDWGGGGMVSSHEKADAITAPIGILVNRETSGAAEALAAIVRLTGSGLILGSRTAGNAMVMEDFPLKDGEHLRIGSAPVTLGDGKALSTQGVKPDIDIAVGEDAERAFYADAFLVVSNKAAGNTATNQPSGTNQTRVRFNEAELVREHRAGESPDEQTAKRPPEAQVPVVSDPALARALDLLKGLAVVRQNNS